MVEVAYTRHAEWRAQQGGVTPALIRTLLEYADIEMPVGRGCTALRVSDQGLYQLSGDQGAALADRVKDIVLIVAENEVLVTVLHARGRPGRRYRVRCA